MKEIAFALKKGKDVPDKFHGAVVRRLIAENLAEQSKVLGLNATISVSGPDAAKVDEVLTRLLNRQIVLYEFQKPAKDASQQKDATIESIQKSVTDRKIGEKTRSASGEPRVPSVTSKLLDRLRKLDPKAAEEMEREMAENNAARKAKRVAKAAAPTAPATPVAPVAKAPAAK